MPLRLPVPRRRSSFWATWSAISKSQVLNCDVAAERGEAAGDPQEDLLGEVPGLLGREAALQEVAADAAVVELEEAPEIALGIDPGLDQLDQALAGIVGVGHPPSLSKRQEAHGKA